MNDHTLKQKIIAEILELSPNLPDEFHAQSIMVHVGFQIRTKYDHEPFDDTIMRYFRQLREEGRIKCECLNKKKSLYKKQP